MKAPRTIIEAGRPFGAVDGGRVVNYREGDKVRIISPYAQYYNQEGRILLVGPELVFVKVGLDVVGYVPSEIRRAR